MSFSKPDYNFPPAKRVAIDININLHNMKEFEELNDEEIYDEIRDDLIKYYCPEEHLDLMCDFYMQSPFGYKYVCLEFLYAFSYTTFTNDYKYIYDNILTKYNNDNLDKHIRNVQQAIRVWFSNQYIINIESKKNINKKTNHENIDNFLKYTYKIKNSFFILLDNGFSVFNASIAIFMMNVRENIYYFTEVNQKKILDVDTFRCIYFECELFARLVECMGVSLEDLKSFNNLIWDFSELPITDKYEIDYDNNKYETTFT
jgi:hypothetical protein